MPTSPSFDDIPDPLREAAGARTAPASFARGRPPAPDRAQAQRRRRAALVSSVGWFASHLVVFGARQDLGALSPAYLLSHIGTPLVLAFASLWVALRSGVAGLGTRKLWLVAIALGAPLSFLLMTLVTPPEGAVHDAHPWLTLVCSDLMLVWMSVPLFAAALALRRAFASGAVWRSALIGSSVGLSSALTLNLHCPNSAPLHLVVGHGLPIIAASLVAAVVISRWLRA